MAILLPTPTEKKRAPGGSGGRGKQEGSQVWTAQALREIQGPGGKGSSGQEKGQLGRNRREGQQGPECMGQGWWALHSSPSPSLNTQGEGRGERIPVALNGAFRLKGVEGK